MGIFANLSANRKIIRSIESVADLDERLKKLERDHKSLDMEFSELHGFVKRSVGRIEKRAATMEAIQQEPEEAEVLSSPEAPPGFDLTPEQLKWQKRIAAERRRTA